MAVTRTTPNTRPHPAARNPGTKGSDVLKWMQAVENDGRHGGKHLREKAQTVYLGIKKSSRVPGGVDKIIAARLIRRRMLKAAAAFDAVAQSMNAGRHDWVRYLGEPGSQSAIRKQGFDLLN